jgi:dienelactone hydrolase
LVVHGGAGLDAHAEGRARRFAEQGYVVFACDMYGDGVAGDRDRERVMSRINELRADRRRLCERAQAGIDVLASHAQVDGRVAAVGYCFGGMTVLELARHGINLAGIVCVHGSLSTTRPAQPGCIKSRILVCHGALDPHSPPAHVLAFIEEMNHATADWQLIVYGGAMHGFTHETATGQTPGVMYHAPTDARSSAAIHRFLDDLFSATNS